MARVLYRMWYHDRRVSNKRVDMARKRKTIGDVLRKQFYGIR
jgi:hypothetical protein